MYFHVEIVSKCIKVFLETRFENELEIVESKHHTWITFLGTFKPLDWISVNKHPDVWTHPLGPRGPGDPQSLSFPGKLSPADQSQRLVSFITLITTADDDWISWSETISDVTVNRNWYKCGNASFDTTIFTTITKWCSQRGTTDSHTDVQILWGWADTQ